MAGHNTLVGERAQRARGMLRSVTDVLDDAGVRYWLDHGTLLGIIREQRLLPWDTDMDIAMDSRSLPNFIECIGELNRRGFRIRRRNYAPGAEIEPRTARLFKVRNRKWFLFKGDLLLDIFVQHRLGERCYWGLTRKASGIQASAPARFFETLGSVEFDGKRYAVPSDTEEYLSYRYGNWRVPVKQWNCFEDDKAVAPGHRDS